MVRADRCCVGPCDNDKRYPDKLVVMKHVMELKWHRFPTKDENKKKVWTSLVGKGRSEFVPSDGSRICSNHFPEGKPTSKHPNPTLYLTLEDYRHPKQLRSRTSPSKKRKVTLFDSEEENGECSGVQNEEQCSRNTFTNDHMYAAMQFAQITRESDVRFFTGFESTKSFKEIFNFLVPRAQLMKYWEGPKRTSSVEREESTQHMIDTIISSPEYVEGSILPINKPGPPRKTSLEQEYLLTLMRLRLGLLIKDLAFRFQISTTRVSQIWITWVKLLSKELRHLIIWPSKGQIYATLPDAFKRTYPKVRVIIDCSEVFVETPSSLEIGAYLWSDYKHHYTIKFLIAITPNGAISWVSPCYGGRTSDVFIVRDSGFLELLEPYDTIMADRGFKIKSDLTMKRCYLAIPPSAAKGNQMISDEVAVTSKVANVRIFVEKAIARVKWFRILSTELTLLELPLVDDILITCSALVNLFPPLQAE